MSRTVRNKCMIIIMMKDFGCVVEHIVAIIASMVKNCQGMQKQRLLSKFAEGDHEKVMFLDLIAASLVRNRIE